jgi:hypothetical protein
LISRARVALGPGFGQVHALHVTERCAPPWPAEPSSGGQI